MKILHLISFLCFSDNKNFYNYVLNSKTDTIHTDILIFSASECDRDNEYKNIIEKINTFNPNIIHFHGLDSLKFIDCIKNFKSSSLILSVYRFELIQFKELNKKHLDIFKVFFIPNDIFLEKSDFPNQSSIFVIKEILNEFPDNTLKNSFGNNYGVILKISKESVSNIHNALEKILETNREVYLTWIIMNKDEVDIIKDSNLYTKFKKYISIEEYDNIKIDSLTGFIVNRNYLFIEKQNSILSFFLHCMMNGKIVLLDSILFIEDMFLDNFNTFLFDGGNYSSLTHILHFLISFKEASLKLAFNTNKTFTDNHTYKKNFYNLSEGYKKAYNSLHI